jgi:hypothetical protein
VTEQQRWRLWIGFVGGSMVAGFTGATVAAAAGSRPGVFVAMAFVALAFVAMVAVSLIARRRPGLLVPPHLQGMGVEQRRLVSESVRRGARVPDGRGAEVAVVHARHQQTAMAMLIASAAVGLSLRVASLSDHPTNWYVDLLGVGFWLLTGTFAVRFLLRARKAAEANASR